ncbi:MAG: hypothetical protein BWK80_16845 [Desulfobacteraceae bacterium IS3]|nr:MAG: hypothetical protein BWK80_16845 [Desulfobacteraceae bacterium IS3]
MKFWQHILYPKEATEKLQNEIEYEKKDKELKYNIAEANWKEEGYKKEKLYQRIFSAVLFLAGVALLRFELKEMGFFALGLGLYGLVPESEQKNQSEPNVNMLRSRLEKMGFFVVPPEEFGTITKNDKKDQAEPKVNILKNQWLWTSVASFILIIVIITIQSVFFQNQNDNIEKLLWFFLGILTMVSITAFKCFINRRTEK